MKLNIKKIGKDLIGLNKFGHTFRLNGNGVWVQLNNKELFKLSATSFLNFISLYNSFIP